MKNTVKEFVFNKLLNSNGKLEGQRLKEKWFIKNKYLEELDIFKKLDILRSSKLYSFLNDNNGSCKNCGVKTRFVGFSEGFKEYCEKCARTINNTSKKQGNINLSLNEIIHFIKDKNNNYSSAKIKSLSSECIENIIKRTSYLKENSSISERLYHIENNLTSLPICKFCGKEHNNFKYSNNGYFDYCKHKCSYIYNKEIRVNESKKYHYNLYVQKFNDEEFIEYNIELFTLEEYLTNKCCDIGFLHKKCGHKFKLNKDYQGIYSCPKCFQNKSKEQYNLNEYLSSQNVKTKYNDRKTIKPLELDILIEEQKIAIEYNGLIWHSFGKSIRDVSILEKIDKNKHLIKTEKCEEKGYSLLHIFENEFLDENKKEIWFSIIRNRLKLNNKIQARKCIIKEISSDESNLFLEQNHLQGKCNASIRIGLYYNNELVSLMTFGKSRYNKNFEYELIRFCSKINNNVIGGANKLLKYFETKYKPKSLISYANRRFSQGKIYETLGFEFIKNTEPNFFYFRPGENRLLSRVSFQKHKLKDKLEVFDSEKTGLENMIENGYRVIYDCGNKVYKKEY